MGLHERAWSGMGILIYGTTPLLPGKLEQALAAATPSNETRIDSFENYDDAFEFSKTKKNIGFILLQENCGNLPAADVFNQLSKPYESKGWPCFGILLHEGQESFIGYRTMKRCQNILSYVSVQTFLDPIKTAETAQSSWDLFTAAFEHQVIPHALQETFLSISSDHISHESVHFQDRVSAAISSRMNISWIESMALRWNPIISILSIYQAKALEPHPSLLDISKMAEFNESLTNAQDIIKSQASLCSRISGLTKYLNKEREAGTLSASLQALATQSKPGAPALLRHTVALKNSILEFAVQAESSAEEARAI